MYLVVIYFDMLKFWLFESKIHELSRYPHRHQHIHGLPLGIGDDDEMNKNAVH